MIRPQWTWSFDDAEGDVLVAPPSPLFTNQYDAEQWLGESWRSLASEGAAVARLLHEGESAAPAVTLSIP
jgi:hypothetical protein